MKQNKKEQFKGRVRDWAEKLEIEIHIIAIRPMKRKWASCSTSGILTFDTNVLDLNPELQDYIVVHELLHFKIPNHGKLWKCLMRAHLGDYEKQEDELKEIFTAWKMAAAQVSNEA
ncbi:putative metal-dependent hydrolase [Methanocalculus alkaliphilus]|uniref:M48 metallopeptidase family protein n=1 Tax=Methanocalculus alkaliphilus TaxID=768730 RepID=UPI0020A0FC66|nr:M48 family metallopeptidase [Methanocalculus alkaliphilus]MCP1715470.1 putative metal-dependent hydrolase [Methanocalculus alkaliphilus]